MPHAVALEASWLEVLAPQFEASYFIQLKQRLLAEKDAGQLIFPKGGDIFRAFNTTPFHHVKVVILGQDPYHGPGQAHGLSFSVPEGIKAPPSLVNIFKELKTDMGPQVSTQTDLSRWAAQGVLLLNSILTVRAHEAASHRNWGWEIFTDAAIEALNAHRTGVVFLLWGAYAGSKSKLIDTQKHLVLKAPHPSPLSAHTGWFGCKHFSQTNKWLINQGQSAIQW
ncbi:MAG: uracil-DNA glycosylase [Sphingobacteriaceae bacterium]|nr:uracil-DNA glycosylase [Sphingobacteriaceae bacterium]